MGLLVNIGYLLSVFGFIFGLKLMAKPAKAVIGNIISSFSMMLGIIATIFLISIDSSKVINLIILGVCLIIGLIIGKYYSYKYEITRMPELVSLFNAFGGLCAVIIGLNEAFVNDIAAASFFIIIVLIVGMFFGAAAFSGSIIAFYKLSSKLRTNNFNQKYLSIIIIGAIITSIILYYTNSLIWFKFSWLLILITVLSILYGIVFSLPVGGADMPVLISLLNAVTGVATALSGLVFKNPIMLIAGILVSSIGIFLTIQMCNAMNRSLVKVLKGNGKKTVSESGDSEANIKTISCVETSSILAYSKSVAIIPGFGMAVSQAQKACSELHNKLNSMGILVKYIIHPVAGRMPGHMNVLLAEAEINYGDIIEMDEANNKMNQFDVAIIIGANDVVNPRAETDVSSPIYGMPIIRAYNSKNVIIMKRGMSFGYAGISNSLFEMYNAKLLFGDAKESLNKIISELKKI